MKFLAFSFVVLLSLSCIHYFQNQKDNNIKFNEVKGIQYFYPDTEVTHTLKMAESFVYEYATSYHWEFTWIFPNSRIGNITEEKIMEFNRKYSYNIDKDWYCEDVKSNIYIFDTIKIKEIKPISGEFTGYFLDRPNRGLPMFKVPKNKALYVYYDLHVIADGWNLERDENSSLNKIVSTYITIYKKDDGQWGILLPSCYKYFTKQGFINYLYFVSELEKYEKKNNEDTLRVIKKLKNKWTL